MSRLAFKLSFGTVAALLAVACGSSDDSAFGDGANNGSNGNSGQGSAFNTDGTNTSAVDPVSAVGNKCAGTSAGLNGLPLQLIVVLDRSGSMCQRAQGGDGENKCSNPESKWQQTTAGLKAFFASDKLKGITATVMPFPPLKQKNQQCEAAPYLPPDSKLIADLPNSGALHDAIQALGQDEDTPTVGALQGAIQHANSLAPKGKVAIIVATDGQPNKCSADGKKDIEIVGDLAAAAASKYKVYAIGIGNSGNLDLIAEKGGTGKAFATNDTASLETALSAIRGATLSCEYAVPAAPAGQVLDFNQVNVVYGTKDGKSVLVNHSADCSNANGWRYDDEAKPTKILLCDASCGTVKGDTVATLDVVLGCATNSSVPGVN